MRYRKKMILKDGRECILRNPGSMDAAAILDHMIQTSDETGNMLRYPDEITMSVEQEKDFLTRVEESTDSIMIAAFVDGQLAANGGLNPVMPYDKCKHRAEFGISIKNEYWGQGIGTAILSSIIEVAKDMGYEQLELDVVASNTRAISLYEKQGFKIYGTREHSFKYRDGHYESLHLMSRNLNQSE